MDILAVSVHPVCLLRPPRRVLETDSRQRGAREVGLIQAVHKASGPVLPPPWLTPLDPELITQEQSPA